jgi:hypothetical protein
VASMGHLTDVYSALVCEPKETNPHGRPRRMCEGIIEVNFNEKDLRV